jgi:hypothetical protein
MFDLNEWHWNWREERKIKLNIRHTFESDLLPNNLTRDFPHFGLQNECWPVLWAVGTEFVKNLFLTSSIFSVSRSDCEKQNCCEVILGGLMADGIRSKKCSLGA